MSRGAGAALAVVSAVYLILIVALAARAGANYEEVVPYVLSRLDIRDSANDASHGAAPRFVPSSYLPRLAFEPSDGVRLPLLNQLYMTDHLSYGGVVLGALGFDRLWAARLWHIAFGLVALWLLYDVARLLGLGRRAALLAVAITATSLQFATCCAVARFDESLPSLGTLAVLWAALHYSRDGRRRWVWVGVIAAALAISGKVTALWPLLSLACAGVMAGWRPPPLRALALPALATAPLFAPVVGFAIAGPAAGNEVNRRLAFLTDLFTSDVILGTAANLIDYLGSWGTLLSTIIRGAPVRGLNWVGLLLVYGTLLWLFVRALAPGPVPRRRRLETQMLAFLGVIFALVVLFYREHRDYQFLLLVPLNAIALAAFLEWCARSMLARYLPLWAAGALVCVLPVAANLWDHRALHEDLSYARNAMLDLDVQRASAAWLVEHDAPQPIVVTFYAVGTYELLTNSVVRPIYGFPLMRETTGDDHVPDLVGAWRTLLGSDAASPRFAVVPVGENAIEARHFDEPAIRAALLEVAAGERAAVFANAHGEPVLEIWRVTPRASPPPEELG